VKDDALLSVIQRYVQEPVVDGGRTWALGLWTREEVVAYLAAAEEDFIQRTQVIVGWQLQDYTAGAGATTLDPEVIEVLTVSVTQAGRGTPCPLVSRHEADLLYPGWPNLSGRPRAAIYGDAGTATLTLVPPPDASGQVHLHVIPVPEPLSGDGDPLTVGDLWEPFVVAGALARMFAKPGQAYNPQRRDQANAIFEFGVALALQRTA
jgi:hypothetical protein